ncbi:ROK family transcriptional regulator [Lederbergia lenta]|uniref:ROK family protein n=1 Tax=Lederbergia lenta TaxID=1467 RepID=A0A2X4W6E8_LEDLE|nr:ROK family transcriptional regulator [Lederbergia lenta]MCM3109771.1 ROK family transcriptional regulator [Lederbergia lenta]MEC2324479.1 ROK family transcriptional regulator [Lederbergia lenta]SQI59796.1 ROK family protein [Lederbergia lenta]
MINSSRKVSKDLMKHLNQKIIMKILKENGTASKSELSKITGLTIPGVTDIVNELEKYHLIKNVGESRIKRGRFPTLFELNKESFKVIGITIRSESIRIGLFNMLGEMVYFSENNLPKDTSPEHTLEYVAKLTFQLLKESNTNITEINGIGLGMHGIVDPINGISIYPPHFNWRNIPIKKILEEKTDLPVIVDNDCNSLALAEYWFGKGEGLNSFIILNIDYGIGASIMIDGKLFHGSDFGAGQIGHTIVHDNGSRCTCGNYGCLETISSELSIIEHIIVKIKMGFPSSITEMEKNPDKITLDHLYLAAEQNDQLAVTTLEIAARYLGIGISTLVNVFNPEKVIVTGGILRGGDVVMRPLNESFNNHALITNVAKLEITESRLGRKADVLGAATLWINELFKGELSLAEIRNNIPEIEP